MNVETALAPPVKDRAEAVTVNGYLLLASGPCTLIECLDAAPCHRCQNEFRVAASPGSSTKSIRLQSRSVDYTCWSGSQRPCSLDARGQHVVVRATLVTVAGGPDLTSLDEPEICEL